MKMFLRWGLPIGALLGSAGAMFAAFYGIDRLIGGVNHSRLAPELIADSLSSLASMNAAVFGIVVTVVSIIVQLSADRFAGVTRMFLRDRVNLVVMSYYLVVCILGVVTSFALTRTFVPGILVAAVVMLTAFGLALMAPYFGYVFWFLEPANIIARIRSTARVASREGLPGERANIANEQATVLSALEELTDISNNAIFSKDKIIASAAVDALKDFAVHYVVEKRSHTFKNPVPAGSSILPGDARAQPNAWFRIGAVIRGNPDFVAMDPESLGDLEARSTWVEWKVLRQYLGIYNEALSEMRDICYLIAINSRYLGEKAADEVDHETLRLVFRYFNSFLRATLNARDVRTAYNVLNQYRLFVEHLIRIGLGELGREGVRHMNYYGVVSFEMKLPFVTETIAYDVGTLCEVAHAERCDAELGMLELFLSLDQPIRTEAEVPALMGVRKAQAKLAAYYLSRNEVDSATRIAVDMQHEPRGRLQQIEQSLMEVVSKDFWEIIDRGRSFEYMPNEQRLCVPRFFALVDSKRQSAQELS